MGVCVVSDADPEIRAIEAVVEVLEPLDPEARERVIEYTFRRLGIGLARAPQPAGSLPPVERLPEPETGPAQVDIRSLRTQKTPRSANEMAALVGYYLAEAAPEGERKEIIGTADIEKYFKQAGHQLPQTPSYTLKNAAAAGYFDAVARGEYKLNPVGYNLVVHGLPRSGTGPASGTSRRKRSTSKKKPAPGTGKRARAASAPKAKRGAPRRKSS